jgi:hypothetical protein
VTELELRLEELGRELAFPPAPELAPRVLERTRQRRPFPWRAAALAFAVLAVAIGTAFAVPQARSAILRFFHLGGATVVRVDTLPATVERSRAGGLGEELTLAQAQRRVGARFLLPPGARPERAFVLGDALVTVVLHYRGEQVLLSEFSSFGPGSLRKLTGAEANVRPAHVNGAQALWIEGPHAFEYYGLNGFRTAPVRVRGNVLLWLRNGRTLRLEGPLTKDQALSLARRVR